MNIATLMWDKQLYDAKELPGEAGIEYGIFHAPHDECEGGWCRIAFADPEKPGLVFMVEVEDEVIQKLTYKLFGVD